MKTMSLLERTESLEEFTKSMKEPGCTLKVAVVYEDFLTRELAGKTCSQVTRLVGQEWLASSWWKVEELPQPAILPAAIEAATRADVLIVSVYASQKMPRGLYSWIDAWLPLRQQQPGALVALISRKGGAPSANILMYLQAVAQLSGLDFLPREHEALQLPDPAPALITPQPEHATTQVVSHNFSDALEAHKQWGINE